jgi:hypothetical protein
MWEYTVGGSLHGNQYGASSKKLKIGLPFDPAVLLLRRYPKESKAVFNIDTYTPIFMATLFTTDKL